MAANKELPAKEKREATRPAEQTRPGLVFTPDTDIFETDTALTLLADMPGVLPENLNIDLRDDVLTISGNVKPYEGSDETDISIEYEIGTYYRQFTLSEIIDQDNIDAALENGVLRLLLPKVEKTAPRKIEIKSA